MNTPTLRTAQRVISLALLAVMLGCQGPLLTGMYLLGYGDTQADFEGLKGKRVVVVCRPLVELQYSNINASKMITREIAKRLRQNVSKIDVVDWQKTNEWLDSNSTEEFVEIGRAFEADLVLAVSLVDFRIYDGQTLYRGHASYEIEVVDCATGRTLFQKSPDECVWPPTTGVPAQDKQESQFRRQFVGVLADEMARHFHSYDHREHFAADSEAFD